MVSSAATPQAGGHLCYWPGGASGQPSSLVQPGRARAGGERFPHVLARHESVGAIAYALRAAGGLHLQPAPLLAAVEQPVLDAPRLLPQPRRLLAQSRHAHHAVRLSAILARRKAAL